MTGGYKLVNLNDINITVDGDEVEVTGVYDAIENNYRKPIIVGGLVIGGVECSNRFVNFRPTSNGLVGLIGFDDSYAHLMIKITSDDKVTIFTQ